MTDETRRADDEPTEIESDLELVGIVAVATNGVIGVDGEMPWHIPEDLAHFKRRTMDHPVVMGRVTYEGIVEGLGEPLPGRTSIVLTRSDLDVPSNVRVVDSVDAAIDCAEAAARDRHEEVDRIYVAGGASVYEQFLPALDRLVLTEVDMSPDGDTRFPELREGDWREVSRDERDRVAFVELERTD
ncbi:dihydrofolate reductase [Halovivax gelatinilyticus]|uniref:dihydrofolate reductase n=1 Tax=Halovivax gelatinilyticus TaxID=2961597 RepID=UPI0020CA934B|nr:dihydrofolate reductase [Halovivax gelatinilyticus]